MTFRARLVLAATTAVVVAILLASLGAYFISKHYLVASLDASLTSAESTFAHTGLNLQQLQSSFGFTTQFVPANNQPPNRELPISPAVRQLADGETGAPFYETITVHGQPWREFVAPQTVKVQSSLGFTTTYESGALQVATPLDGVNDQLRDLRIVLVVVAIGGIILAVLLGWLVARATLVPLNELTAAVEEVAQTTDVSRRLDPGGPDELGRLRRAFNRLLSALEASREAQRKLVLDAAHELRTPLTSLRTNMEVARRLDELPEGDRQVLTDDVITQMDELTELVSGLTELARGEHHEEQASAFRLDRLVDDAVALATVHGRSRGLRFDVTSQETWVLGRRERINRAVTNLLDNAVKWSPQDGVIAVSCTGGQVVVRDQGPGIAPDDLPHVFDRFYRAPAARALPGSGLGLAIVAQVATEEGGAVSAQNASGGGAEMRISFPPVPAPPGAVDDD